MNMRAGFLPNKYLGIPFPIGRNTTDFWDSLIEKCKKKWKVGRGDGYLQLAEF